MRARDVVERGISITTSLENAALRVHGKGGMSPSFTGLAHAPHLKGLTGCRNDMNGQVVLRKSVFLHAESHIQHGLV